MSGLLDLFVAHALFGWLAVGAVFLIVELLTGSGWLLWPAGSAALTAVASAVSPGLDLWAQAAIFAVLTIVTTYLGRRFINRGPRAGGDLNDRGDRVIGHAGKAATPFEGGLGRVFVDGKEWAAILDGGEALAKGASVEVVALEGGARLRVKAA